MSAAKHKCEGRVWHSSFHHSECGRNAAYEHEGAHFCKTHHPPTVAAKQATRNAEWKAAFDLRSAAQKEERAKAAERDRRAELFPELLDALKAATCTIELEYGRDSCPTYRALIAKATGSQS